MLVRDAAAGRDQRRPAGLRRRRARGPGRRRGIGSRRVPAAAIVAAVAARCRVGLRKVLGGDRPRRAARSSATSTTAPRSTPPPARCAPCSRPRSCCPSATLEELWTPAIADFGAPPRPQIGSTQFAAPAGACWPCTRAARAPRPSPGATSTPTTWPPAPSRRSPSSRSKSYSETAPSIELGRSPSCAAAAARRPAATTGRSARRSAPKRLSATLARETATNGTRVAYTYNSSRGGGLAVRLLSGHAASSSRSRASPSSRAARC